jgi:hypothetical protein
MEKSLKSCALVLGLMEVLTFSGCGGGNSPGPYPSLTNNIWTWESGISGPNDLPGVYGTQGTPAASNTPGARDYASSWTDGAGNLWLFGGIGLDSQPKLGDLNDLWKYSNRQWTWVGGSNQIEQAGTYGTQGVPGPDNFPGARYEAAASADPTGNFWLFGGVGIDSTGTRGELGDLWKYSGGQWVWMSGPNIGSQPGGYIQRGVYGIQGAPAAGNVPGARIDAVSWADASGNLWLFGGNGWDSNATGGDLNDLWKYSGGEWTWMSGSNIANQYGTYGTLGTPAPGNTPGARALSVTWTDKSGNFWLFGGEGNDLNGIQCEKVYPGAPCLLSDLWKYSGGQWTWMGGPNITQQPGVYGTQGTPAPGNIPGGRWGAVSWTDAAGNFWLFGGFGYDSRTNPEVYGDLNDLWRYANGEWTWMSGSNLVDQSGAYGTLGVADPANVPGCRDGAVSWVDLSGNLWLFGGGDYQSLPGGRFNDLWKYQP